MPRFFDSHVHLQAEALLPFLDTMLPQAEALGVVGWIVNGTRENDWELVADLAKRSPNLVPSFGLHPWYVNTVGEDWQALLLAHLDSTRAGVGEIGLDRWIQGHDLPKQEVAFLWQLGVATERNLPVTIHCLRAWGRLLELLQSHWLPENGFLLHAYGGPKDMVPRFVELGAYFSFSGYFAHERKAAQREAFLSMPIERILVETDAPAMLPPVACRYEASSIALSGDVNNPLNLLTTYQFAAELREMPLATFSDQVATNYQRFFAPILPRVD